MGVYAPNANVEAPACTPPKFGLQSVVTLLDQDDSHELNGVIYQPNTCVAPVGAWEAVCPPAVPATKTETDVVPDDVVGDPFHLYATRSCRRSTLEAMKGEVAEDFERGEWRGIEREVWNRILAQPTSVILNTIPGPAGALSVTAAIAALESYTSENYSCRALFHSDRGVTPYAITDHQLVVVGGALSTFLGSAWAAYTASPNVGPDGLPAPDGHAWIYASSGLVLRRFPLSVQPEQPGQMLERDLATGQLTNEPFVLAERTYVPTVECGVAAVLVCLGTCE